MRFGYKRVGIYVRATVIPTQVSLRFVQQKVMHCRHDPSLRGAREFGLLLQPILGRLSKVAVVLELMV